MDSAKDHLVEAIKNANNVLVTVGRNPSVDGLAALVGLTLMLNKQGKHSAAVFSGKIPSTIEFLEPEQTIEKNTDSLRDFIIALDKNKADKLRYKVEDDVVRIFITPYKTSISEADLDFSQGDFNVDLVVALGVNKQEDLDEAITTHGRILHDAVLASINVAGEGGLGSINWNETNASSLSELVAELAESLGDDTLDEQIATALLTGIVAETDRFSNDKTSSGVMRISANLMSAGANQQLIATKLQEPELPAKPQEKENSDKESDQEEPKPEGKKDDGTLEIEHQPSDDPKKKTEDPDEPSLPNVELPAPKDYDEPPQAPTPFLPPVAPSFSPQPPAPGVPGSLTPGPRRVTQPPSMGGTLTANSSQQDLEPTTDPLSMPSVEPPKLLDHKADTVSQLPAEEDLAPPPALPTTLSPPSSQPSPALFNPLPPPPLTSPVSHPTLAPPPPPPAPAPVTPPLPVSEPKPTVTGMIPTATLTPPPSDTPAPTLITPTTPPPKPAPSVSPASPVQGLTPPPPAWVPPAEPEQPAPSVDEKEDEAPIAPELHIDEDGTLSQIEKSVASPHVEKDDGTKSADNAREEINKALNSAPSTTPPSPIAALNAQPLGASLHPSDDNAKPTQDNKKTDQTKSNSSDPPPPVPPPIPFEFGKPPQA